MARLRIAAIVLASAFAVAGCGTGGGNGDQTTPPTPTAVPTSSATPAAPTATATAMPLPFPELALASVVEYSAKTGFLDRVSVLRNVGDGWERVPVAAPLHSYLGGLAFSAPEVVWGFGFTGEESPLLARSDDGGRSWTDVSARLPAECRRIVDLTFVNDTVAYLVSRGQVVERRVFGTRDAGRTWTEIAAFAPGVIPSNYALETRGIAVELVRSTEPGAITGLVVSRVDDPSLAPVQLEPAPTGFGGASAFTVAGLRGWIAAPDAIFASETPGGDWIEQSIGVEGGLHLAAIDVRDADDGIAGGELFTDDGGRAPVLLSMNSETHAWEQATIVDPLGDSPDDVTVTNVLRLQGDTAWAATSSAGVGFDRLLRSDDGGRSWRVDSVLEKNFIVSDLVRNTAGR